MSTVYVTLDARYLSHDTVRAALGIPAACGRNLDALHDALMERATPTELTLLHIEEAEGFPARILAVLRDSAAENPRLRVRER